MASNYPEKEGDNYPDDDRKDHYVIKDPNPSMIGIVDSMRKSGHDIHKIAKDINEIFGKGTMKREGEDRDAPVCPRNGTRTCACERVRILQDNVAALILNGNLILSFLKALVQTTDPELIDTLPERIEAVQEIFQNRS